MISPALRRNLRPVAAMAAGACRHPGLADVADLNDITGTFAGGLALGILGISQV
jgi:hypothetical protein